MTEAKLTKKCRDRLRELGALCIKIHGGPHQPAGTPDLIGCYEGVFFGIEMKLPGKEKNLTERQAKNLRDIERAGGIARVCTSVEQCVDVLHEIEEI